MEIWCQGHLNKEAARDGYLMEHDLRNQQTQGHHHSTTPHTVGANGSIHHEANHDPESDLPYVKGNAIVGSKDVQKTPARVAFLFVCFGAITVAIVISLLVVASIVMSPVVVVKSIVLPSIVTLPPLISTVVVPPTTVVAPLTTLLSEAVVNISEPLIVIVVN